MGVPEDSSAAQNETLAAARLVQRMLISHRQQHKGGQILIRFDQISGGVATIEDQYRHSTSDVLASLLEEGAQPGGFSLS